MTDREFQQVLKRRLGLIQATLGTKAKEYARGNDRLWNFKRGAAIMRCTPEKALIGFWMKHVISLLDMVDDLQGHIMGTRAQWDEKIGDAIVYLVLLEACISGRFGAVQPDDMAIHLAIAKKHMRLK